MKKIVIYSILTLSICLNFACSEVGTNNKVANGDVATAEDSDPDKILEEALKDKIKKDANSETKTSEKSEMSKEANSPEALVEDLYKEEEKDNNPFFQNKDRPLINTYFAKDLAEMIWKDAVNTKDDEVGKIDFDPLYDAQDAEVANLNVGKSEINGDKATVEVTFLNFGEEQSVNYLLKKENGDWKIEDINYEEGSLATILKADIPTAKTATDE